ncbi:helix-turn-helix transcriptional regulator [Sphaerotilus natans]|nr:helix-turn-helix domain-containing protein [Sphaerotilus natans]
MFTKQPHHHQSWATKNANQSPVKMMIDSGLADMARLSIKEIAALAGLCEQSIRNKIKTGEFPAADYRSGPRCVRWSAGVVRQWLESTRTPTEQ